VRVLVDAAGFQGQAESPLQSGVRDRLGGVGRSVMPCPWREEQRGWRWFSIAAEQFQRALRQGT
jgi:hypothetical protein